MSMKMAIFPLFFWIFKLSSSLGSIIFILILTLQKVPMFLIFFKFDSNLIFFFLISSFVSGTFLIFFCDNIKNMLICSSISSSFWLYLFYLQDFFLFLLFFFFYSLLIWVAFSNSPISLDSSSGLLFCFLCGLPPFSLFFFKYYLSSYVYDLSGGLFFSFWVLSFFCLLGYTKFFFFNFFFDKFLYLKQEFCSKKTLFLGISVLCCFPFVV